MEEETMRKTTLATVLVVVTCLAAASLILFGIGENTIDVEAADGGTPSADIYVDDNADTGWYDATHVQTIQEGIGNASAGDTVYVYNGTYHENVIVNKKVNLVGEDRTSTIIDGGGSGDVVKVNADDVTISGVTVQNSGSDYDAGIKLDGVQHCRIENTTTNNSGIGIWLASSSNSNTVSGNTVSRTSSDGGTCLAQERHSSCLNRFSSSSNRFFPWSFHVANREAMYW